MTKSKLINDTRHQQSLKGRFIRYFCGTTVGLMVVVILIVSVVLVNKLGDELEASLSAKAYHLMTGMERRVSYLVETINNFSSNHFVINSLVHPQRREEYLSKMVDDLGRMPNIDSITILDYAGHLVQSSLANPPDYRKLLYLRPTLETGKSLIDLSHDLKSIVIVEPIQHYQTPIGAVISEINLADLISQIIPQQKTEFHKLYSLDNLILSDNFEETETYFVVNYNPGEDTPYLNELQVKIELGTVKSRHLEPVNIILYQLIGIGIIMIILSIVISIQIGNNLARPILNLVQQIAQAGSSQKQRYSPLGTDDELEILAQALDDREMKLSQFRNHLEEMVAKRTKELVATQETLTQTINDLDTAKERSEQKAKELEAFSFSVSHDLKGPLRGIDGYAKLLEDAYKEQLDEEGLYFLEMVCQSAQQMNQIIEDLLKYSRLDRDDLQFREIDLSVLIEDILSMERQTMEGADVGMDISLEVEKIKGEREGLFHAVDNVFQNAIKFSRSVEYPKIAIRSYEKDGEIIIEIKDNGIGFDMKYHDQIFSIFQRLEKTEDYPGTGIGLAIVKKVIDRNRGRVWAESERGKGSIFYLALPNRA